MVMKSRQWECRIWVDCLWGPEVTQEGGRTWIEGFWDSRREFRSANSLEEKEEGEEPGGLGLKQTGALTPSVDYWFSGTAWP